MGIVLENCSKNSLQVKINKTSLMVIVFNNLSQPLVDFLWNSF